MNTLTNERLNKIASWRKTYGDAHNVMMPAHEAEELVSRLFAAENRSMQLERDCWIYEGTVKNLLERAESAEAQLAELLRQEPVAWTDEQELRGLAAHNCAYLYKIDPDNPYHDPRRQIMLYRAPVPPAASQPMLSDEFRYYIDDQIKFYSHMCDRDDAVGTVDALTMSQRRLQFYQQAKSCFRQTSQPCTVPDEWTYSDAVQFVLINGMSNETRSGIAMHVFNHCRAAMLQSSGNAEQKGKRLRIAEGRYAAYFPQERPIAGTRVIAWDEKGNLLGVGFGRDTRETGITIVINGKKYDSNHVLHWCSASMESGDSPAIPDGYCIMPLKLTAENGAKGALSGEFHISRTVTCHECGGEGCEDCNDQGSWEEEILIGWDIIKLIYQSAVDACSKTDKASS
ncbi:hypothetical protein [Pectobacterium odoriferum]|uniref:hypothetical protein n=1 Tax=Pectobacterium odoriferum TaxID=78398 RepID=UPI000CD264CA|nr:hypothetical protein [Pectobacterium odoriferum]POD92307.1 hypothetical protein BVY06_19500 [Pectobacterium odoriferum]POE39909.1 hypothetical protein BV920_10995 [Pectobacterium odoriferum]